MLALPALLLLAHVARAITLSVTGDPQVGNPISLAWTGLSPWSLDILTADAGDGDFTLYKNFSPLTVLNAVWNVDVPLGTLVQFEITDATGASTIQLLTVGGDDGAALSSSSVISTQSMASTLSEVSATSVASISSASDASISSAAASESAVSATSTLPITISTPMTTTRPTQTAAGPTTHAPSVTAHSSAAVTTSSSAGSTGLPNTAAPQSSGPSAGAVAGGVIGGILAVMIIAVLIWTCHRRRQRRAYDLEPHPYVESSEDGEKAYAFGANNSGSTGISHRRTLSRGQVFGPPAKVNWNPEQPHLTPNVTAVNGNGLFANEQRKTAGLSLFTDYLDATNALNVNLHPSPAPPPPAMTMANIGRPSVLDIARASPPKNESSFSYNPTSIQQPGFGYSVETYTPTTAAGGSPFADKFAVEGRYVPDLQDPAVSASYATATGGQAALSPAPRPPRPERPAAGLDRSNTTTITPRRQSFASNPGPVPTVGHKRKISGPIPIVFNSPPPSAQTVVGGPSGLPSWALHSSDDSRYPTAGPTVNVQTPTTASSSGGMAGVGAFRNGDGGRPIYPAAAMGPRPAKRTSASQQPRYAKQMASPPPTMALPLTPPRRPSAAPDVPTTPTTPNLSSFPTPPRMMHIGSSSSSSLPTMTNQTSIDSTSSSKSRGLQPPPISTAQATAAYNNGGLSPIAASPLSQQPVSSPIASSQLHSPTTPNKYNPARSTATSTTDRMNSILRRELQGGQNSMQPSPISPSSGGHGTNANNLNNFNFIPRGAAAPQQPPMIPERESWLPYGGKAISLSSAASGRRLSDESGAAADAEWKELERQLQWAAADADSMLMQKQQQRKL